MSRGLFVGNVLDQDISVVEYLYLLSALWSFVEAGTMIAIWSSSPLVLLLSSQARCLNSRQNDAINQSNRKPYEDRGPQSRQVSITPFVDPSMSERETLQLTTTMAAERESNVHLPLSISKASCTVSSPKLATYKGIDVSLESHGTSPDRCKPSHLKTYCLHNLELWPGHIHDERERTL